MDHPCQVLTDIAIGTGATQEISAPADAVNPASSLPSPASADDADRHALCPARFTHLSPELNAQLKSDEEGGGGYVCSAEVIPHADSNLVLTANP